MKVCVCVPVPGPSGILDLSSLCLLEPAKIIFGHDKHPRGEGRRFCPTSIPLSRAGQAAVASHWPCERHALGSVIITHLLWCRRLVQNVNEEPNPST